MFPSAYLLVLLAQPQGVAARDEIAVSQASSSLMLAWADAEDRLQGAVTPLPPTSGKPLEASLHVGTFQGPEWNGPLTVTLKPSDASSPPVSQTVTRAAGEKAWRAHFVPVDEGDHLLEVSFRTTRLKTVRAHVMVARGSLPRWPWWVMLGLASAAALGLGVRSVLKKDRP